MKKFNPTTPIMLREAAGTLPKVYARYEFGREKSQSLEGMQCQTFAARPSLSTETTRDDMLTLSIRTVG